MPNNQIKSLTVDGTTYDLVDETSGYITGMTILSYGSSTWQDFIDAYNSNKVVYCRASSNSNPGTGQLNRLAFLAYVDSADNPTNVEFQYYRSVSTHSASQQGDQVFVYTLTSSNSWSVTTREAATKIVTSGDLTSSYNSGTLTISANIASTKANAGLGISEEADFDDILIDGRYWIDITITLDNAPIDADGILEVITTTGVNSGNVFQRFSVYNSDQKYWRTKVNNTWTQWFYESDTAQKQYADGKATDAITQANAYTNQNLLVKANAGFGNRSGDLNDITTDGVYWVNAGETTNTPFPNNSGMLRVRRTSGVNDGHIHQEYSIWNGMGYAKRMYVGDNGWSDWSYVTYNGGYINQSFTISAGEKFKIEKIKNNKAIMFSIPLTSAIDAWGIYGITTQGQDIPLQYVNEIVPNSWVKWGRVNDGSTGTERAIAIENVGSYTITFNVITRYPITLTDITGTATDDYTGGVENIVSVAWAAASSASTSTKLSGVATLNRGKWIACIRFPTCSALILARLNTQSGTTTLGNTWYMQGESQQSNIRIFEVTSKTAQVYLGSAQNGSVTFSNTDRGGVEFIRIN